MSGGEFNPFASPPGNLHKAVVKAFDGHPALRRLMSPRPDGKVACETSYGEIEITQTPDGNFIIKQTNEEGITETVVASAEDLAAELNKLVDKDEGTPAPETEPPVTPVETPEADDEAAARGGGIGGVIEGLPPHPAELGRVPSTEPGTPDGRGDANSTNANHGGNEGDHFVREVGIIGIDTLPGSGSVE
ncbi:MAG: hypothetical protein RLN62_03045 [Rickettsiales bacterium]